MAGLAQAPDKAGALGLRADQAEEAVAAALAQLTGQAPPKFLHGKLAATVADAPSPRETLWPARLDFSGGQIQLRPQPWASSGDVTCFAAANALIRVPVNQGSLAAGAEVDFLPTTAMLDL